MLGCITTKYIYTVKKYSKKTKLSYGKLITSSNPVSKSANKPEISSDLNFGSLKIKNKSYVANINWFQI